MSEHQEDATDDADAQRRRRQLRAALDGLKLTPESTTDDEADPREEKRQNRDDEFARNRPPHHEEK